ncbi:MAG: hypothetical protein GF411_04205 [Candidatus Lokiarchaeota archaeon]|nr:hypothetical protein [Candidatus Lokiarchaeota archaeon]
MQIVEIVIDILIIILGLVVAGEAIALFLGSSLSGFERQTWQTIPNITFLVFDIITGVAIVFLTIAKKELTNYPLVLSTFIVVIIITHLLRDIEFLIDTVEKFIANTPLLVVNNLKLIIAIFLLIAEFLNLRYM